MPSFTLLHPRLCHDPWKLLLRKNQNIHRGWVFKKRGRKNLSESKIGFSSSVLCLKTRLPYLPPAQETEPRAGEGRRGGHKPVGTETQRRGVQRKTEAAVQESGGANEDRPGVSWSSKGLLTSGKLHRADVPLPAMLLISTSVCLSSGCQQRHGLLP